MERCICTNKELVASCAHPYCPEHGWDEERDAALPTALERIGAENVLEDFVRRNGNENSALVMRAWLVRVDRATKANGGSR